MRKLIYILLITTEIACQSDDDQFRKSTLDIALERAVESQAPNGAGLGYYILPDESDYSNIPNDPKNQITKEKVELGKLLFHETGLAQNPMNEIGRETYSCASCHHAQGGFQADRFQGIGDGAVGFGRGIERDKSNLYQDQELDVQPIRTPSAMNIAYQINVLWNGQFGATGLNTGTEDKWTVDTPKEVNTLGFEGTETQAIAGLDVHRLVVNEDLVTELGYKSMFDQAFPEVPSNDRYNTIIAGLAIAAYERTILSNEAPFQKWLRGEFTAMTTQQKEGAVLFFGKAECTNCHNGPSLANMEFHAIGMNDLYQCPDPVFNVSINDGANLGRADFTGEEDDKFKFKVPQLYNLKDSPFYGHGSSFTSIRDVLEYKNRAIKQNNTVSIDRLSEFFHPLSLSEEELNELTAFIEHGLYDPNLNRFVPDEVLSGNCFPNNDLLSQQDLGCN